MINSTDTNYTMDSMSEIVDSDRENLKSTVKYRKLTKNLNSIKLTISF